MKKLAVSGIFLLAVAVLIFPLEVDEEEIRVDASAIEFINYTGPHTQIDTIQEIVSIGAGLGDAVSSSPRDAYSGHGDSRYYVIHAVDTSVKEGFDADIFILGGNASVDHIDNLRRIISAYLSHAYGYSTKDADTLSVFITVYNAVYRGNTDYFSGKYKQVVMNELTADKAGLALSYKDWPGKTQIVIPLSDPAFSGTLSSVDTTSLTEDEVIESIKTDESSPQDTRRDMTELKEREGDEAQERADEARREAEKAEAEAAQAGERADEAQKEADEAKQAAEEAAAEAEANPDDEEAAQAAEEAAAEAEKKQQEADAIKEEQAAAEERAAEKTAEAEREQEMADRKQQEAQSERQQIAADTQKEIDSENEERMAAITSANPVAGLRVTDESELLSEILLLNTSDGSTLKTSPINSIRNRTLVDSGDAYMAVAGKNDTVKLVLIDRYTLEVTKESAETIAAESMLAKSNNDYYAVINRNGTAYLARFDKDLNVQARSSIAVLPYTAITITDNGIIIQDSSSKLRILRATDLVDLNN